MLYELKIFNLLKKSYFCLGSMPSRHNVLTHAPHTPTPDFLSIIFIFLFFAIFFSFYYFLFSNYYFFLSYFVSMHEHTFVDLNMEFYITLEVNSNDSHIFKFRMLGKSNNLPILSCNVSLILRRMVMASR